MSALSVVMPALPALLPNRAARRHSSISESDRETCVEERCTMVTSAPCSQRSAQMSWAELFEPMTTHFLPLNASPPGCRLEWWCTPAKSSMPAKFRHVRARPTCRSPARAAWDAASSIFPARSTTTVQRLFFLVEFRAFAFGGAPIVELHHLGVHFQPVADLVLGREDRPMIRERQIGQMVVPDGIMQAERSCSVCAIDRPAARACRR